MEKKKFLPARLVKGSSWYILYYQTNPATGRMERFRETRQINRIKDKRERAKIARAYVKDINSMLPSGWPFQVEQPDAKYTVKQAVQLALQAKINTTELNTHRSYQSHARIFLQYCEEKKISQLDIRDFTKKDAYNYMDYVLIERKLSPKTYNNYVIHMRSLWYVMVEREMIQKNPFVGIKRAAVEKKNRRTFTADERKVVARFLQENDLTMFWAILLQYYCFLRPVELRRLRFRNFDLVAGTITITPDINRKSKKHRIITIPPFALGIFRDPSFTQNPTNYFVFGEHLRPHRSKQCSPNAMNKRHKRYMKALKKRGDLHDIDGLKFYSWKDTGITDHSKLVSLINLQRQAGHAKPETTLIYYQPDEINYEMRGVDNDIFS
jgi:integrase